MSQLVKITFNAVPKGTRVEMLDGREHLVVPMVMITEGVWEGSDGPLFYHGDDLKGTSSVWNHKPVVIYHPEINGVGVTACDPVILNKQGVGLILNSKYDSKNRLKAEAWLDTAKLKAVDERVLTLLEKGEPINVSTGLFVDLVPVKNGDFKGKKYEVQAKNFRPDHLAILPDKKGACSLEDGAGLLVNEASLRDISSQVRVLLAAKHGEKGRAWDGYIEEVYTNKVIFFTDWNCLHQQGYSVDYKGVVSLVGDAVPVQRVVSFVPIKNERTMNEAEKKAKVDEILTKNLGYTETDRVALLALDPGALEMISKIKTIKVEGQPVGNTGANPVPNPVQLPGTSNQSLTDYIQNAPPEIRHILNHGVVTYNQQKEAAIGLILNNPRNRFTREFLIGKELAELQAIAEMALPQAPTTPQMLTGNGANYSVAGGVVANQQPAGTQQTPVANQGLALPKTF